VLHLAPEAVLRRVIEPLAGAYETADLVRLDVTHPRQDLTRHTLPEFSYDMVLCNHVLEHIADDDAAVAGLARLPRAAGLVVVTVPGNFLRAETVRFVDDSLNGHWRDYGRDVRDLFARHFARVDLVDLHAYDTSADGLSNRIFVGETAFVLCEPKLAGTHH
jgi:SAM-dependent methyltransferase